ncbi:MAG: cell division protein ZapA [Alphaproteobacteria bacterium]|nr:cell division protein ZapA [Alphaproteobacteria bacterium]
MGQVAIIINKREYVIVCEDGQEEHIVKLSKILDERAQQVTGGSRSINENMMLALVGLTLADELQDIKDGLFCIRPEDVAKDDAALAQNIDRQTSKIADLIKDIKEVKA